MKLGFDVINPKYRLSTKDNKMIHEIEDLLKAAKISDKKKKNIAKKKSQVRSIYSSLAIEANSLSLEEVDSIYHKEKIIGDRKEIQEVKNAIELYSDFSKFNWRKEKDLKKAHSILMKYFDIDNGKYRSHGEGIKKGNKIVFQAPESILVPGLMNSLFDYININSKEIHPFVLSSLFHYYFVYIHPYTDGNGRTARFWVSLILADFNDVFTYLPIEEIIYKHQKDYYLAIESSHNNGNANAFISFMLKVIKETIIITTQETTQKKLNDNQVKIIKLIKRKPYITRKELSKELHITSDGVKYNLNKLKQLNIIERIGPDKGGYWKIK